VFPTHAVVLPLFSFSFCSGRLSDQFFCFHDLQITLHAFAFGRSQHLCILSVLSVSIDIKVYYVSWYDESILSITREIHGTSLRVVQLEVPTT
jgi:hypothetical protein